MKHYCTCCGKQIVKDQHPKPNNPYITIQEGAKKDCGSKIICGYCAKDLDENGLFPEEQLLEINNG